MARMTGTAARGEQLLGVAVVSTTPVAGGDICTATRLRLSNGRSAVIKTRPQAPAGFFAAEARGLRWLAEAGGAPVPDVLAVDDDCLVLDWIEPGANTHSLGAYRWALVAIAAMTAFGIFRMTVWLLRTRVGVLRAATRGEEVPVDIHAHRWDLLDTAEFRAVRVPPRQTGPDR